MVTGNPLESDQQQDAGKDFESVVRSVVSQGLARVEIGVPGTVVSYDSETQKVTVKPTTSARRNDGLVIDVPPIPNVPVQWPGGDESSVGGGLASGDFVWLTFASRSLDDWLTKGGSKVEPKDKRRFDISDAVAIPGVNPFLDGKPFTGPGREGFWAGQDPSRVSSPQRFEARRGGGMYLGDDATNLLKEVRDAIDIISQTSFGGQPMLPSDILLLQAIVAKFDLLLP